MFSWYKYPIVSLVFSHLGFWSGNLFLIASFPDLCLLVTFYITDRSKAILVWWFFLFYVLVFKTFVLLAPCVCFHILS